MKSPKPLILVVDDQPANLQILAELLGDDYLLKIAINGYTALKIAGMPDKPDLILLDVVMPQMDGYEVCRRLKDDMNTRDIPIIFITAKNETRDEERGFNCGAVDYITKPFSPVIVQARVRTHIHLKHNMDLLESMAFLDGLTGIPNRRHFDKVINIEWKRARRNKTDIALLLADVDHFKQFNDHYGHGPGDDCLRQIAAVFSASLYREGDFTARYGGEEFAVLLPAAGLSGLMQVAERIRSAVEDLAIPHAYSPIADHVTISLGGHVLTPSEHETENDLIQQADGMLYKAKAAGRNQSLCSSQEDSSQ